MKNTITTFPASFEAISGLESIRGGYDPWDEAHLTGTDDDDETTDPNGG